MREAVLNVTLLHHTEIGVAVKAARICVGEEFELGSTSLDKQVSYLKKLLKRGHLSVFEHASFSFYIEGVSRACLQQLARHRHVSLSVQSTRWALKKHEEYVLPAKLSEADRDNFKYLLGEYLFCVRSITKDLGNDLAKYLYPECLATKLVLTVNFRELAHICGLRMASNAMREFQALCEKLLEALPGEFSTLMAQALKEEGE